jgi:hypothetical protein
MHDRAEFQTLYTAYRRAWRLFANEVELGQSQNAINRAELLYRETRNRLADYLISNKSRVETFPKARASVASESGASLPTA